MGGAGAMGTGVVAATVRVARVGGLRLALYPRFECLDTQCALQTAEGITRVTMLE